MIPMMHDPATGSCPSSSPYQQGQPSYLSSSFSSAVAPPSILLEKNNGHENMTTNVKAPLSSPIRFAAEADSGDATFSAAKTTDIGSGTIRSKINAEDSGFYCQLPAAASPAVASATSSSLDRVRQYQRLVFCRARNTEGSASTTAEQQQHVSPLSKNLGSMPQLPTTTIMMPTTSPSLQSQHPSASTSAAVIGEEHPSTFVLNSRDDTRAAARLRASAYARVQQSLRGGVGVSSFSSSLSQNMSLSGRELLDNCTTTLGHSFVDQNPPPGGREIVMRPVGDTMTSVLPSLQSSNERHLSSSLLVRCASHHHQNLYVEGEHRGEQIMQRQQQQQPQLPPPKENQARLAKRLAASAAAAAAAEGICPTDECNGNIRNGNNNNRNERDTGSARMLRQHHQRKTATIDAAVMMHHPSYSALHIPHALQEKSLRRQTLLLPEQQFDNERFNCGTIQNDKNHDAWPVGQTAPSYRPFYSSSAMPLPLHGDDGSEVQKLAGDSHIMVLSPEEEDVDSAAAVGSIGREEEDQGHRLSQDLMQHQQQTYLLTGDKALSSFHNSMGTSSMITANATPTYSQVHTRRLHYERLDEKNEIEDGRMRGGRVETCRKSKSTEAQQSFLVQRASGRGSTYSSLADVSRPNLLTEGTAVLQRCSDRGTSSTQCECYIGTRDPVLECLTPPGSLRRDKIMGHGSSSACRRISDTLQQQLTSSSSRGRRRESSPDGRNKNESNNNNDGNSSGMIKKIVGRPAPDHHQMTTRQQHHSHHHRHSSRGGGVSFACATAAGSSPPLAVSSPTPATASNTEQLRVSPRSSGARALQTPPSSQHRHRPRATTSLPSSASATTAEASSLCTSTPANHHLNGTTTALSDNQNNQQTPLLGGNNELAFLTNMDGYSPHFLFASALAAGTVVALTFSAPVLLGGLGVGTALFLGYIHVPERDRERMERGALACAEAAAGAGLEALEGARERCGADVSTGQGQVMGTSSEVGEYNHLAGEGGGGGVLSPPVAMLPSLMTGGIGGTGEVHIMEERLSSDRRERSAPSQGAGSDSIAHCHHDGGTSPAGRINAPLGAVGNPLGTNNHSARSSRRGQHMTFSSTPTGIMMEDSTSRTRRGIVHHDGSVDASIQGGNNATLCKDDHHNQYSVQHHHGDMTTGFGNGSIVDGLVHGGGYETNEELGSGSGFAASAGFVGNVIGNHQGGGNGGSARIAAILRQGVVTPVSQIHSLPPKNQPKAWLNIMSSYYSTSSECIEAMEEIKILTKDKHNAKMFLDEGILDSLMYLLDCYWYLSSTEKDSEGHKQRSSFSSLEEQTYSKSARLASNCIIALAKVHCLSSGLSSLLLAHNSSGEANSNASCQNPGSDNTSQHLYAQQQQHVAPLYADFRNGTVPLERQVAQLLIEVPHYSCCSFKAMLIGGNSGIDGVDQLSAAATTFYLKEVCVTDAIEKAKKIILIVEEKWDTGGD